MQAAGKVTLIAPGPRGPRTGGARYIYMKARSSSRSMKRTID